MKTKQLKDILGNEELSLEEKAAQIMALNGQDINTAKESSSVRVQELESELEDLKAKNTELTGKVNSHKDYDELLKFKNDTLSEKENNQKKEYLTKIGFKRPDLFFDKLDWTKAKYDAEKKEYSGIDIDTLKTTYADLYNEPNSSNGGTINFGAVGNSAKQEVTPNASMNAFLRGQK